MAYYKAQRIDTNEWVDLPVNLFSLNIVREPDGIVLYEGVRYRNVMLYATGGITNIDSKNINLGGSTGNTGSAVIIENGDTKIHRLPDGSKFQNDGDNQFFIAKPTSIKDMTRALFMCINGVVYFKGFHWRYDADKERIYWIHTQLLINDIEEQEIFIVYQIEPKNIIQINPTNTIAP